MANIITPQELRIGNYLYPSEPQHNKIPFKIGAGDILEIQRGMPNYKYEPIPLTPEILEKCGFDKIIYDAHKRNPIIIERLPEIAAKDFYDFKIKITNDGGQICIEENDEWDIWYGKQEAWDDRLPLVSIKFLHQLQNLYFALTGNELEVNL